MRQKEDHHFRVMRKGVVLQSRKARSASEQNHKDFAWRAVLDPILLLSLLTLNFIKTPNSLHCAFLQRVSPSLVVSIVIVGLTHLVEKSALNLVVSVNFLKWHLLVGIIA